MSDLSRWWSLPVQDFFTQVNWSGQAFNQQLKPNHKPVKLSETWQLSPVKTFFENCSWYGKISVVDASISLEPSACLTISVREFFGLITWGEGMLVSTPIKPSTETELLPVALKQNTIDDLAQLF